MFIHAHEKFEAKALEEILEIFGFSPKEISILTENNAAEVVAHLLHQTGVPKQRAVALVKKFGVARCVRQLKAFPDRVALARRSPGGLRNPVGLLIRSIQQNWSAPSPLNNAGRETWYSEEEFESMILH